MGRIAAEMMHRRLIGDRLEQARILVPPKGLNALASSRHQPTYDPYIMRARHYIRQFAAQGVKVAQVAAYVGVSRATLDMHFRKAFGWTVHDDMLAFRLERAQQMLADRRLSFAEVAARSGFTSLPYMYAVFRRELHCTPTEFQATLSVPVFAETTGSGL
jgi:LacI family transcriptional regulator